MNHLSKLHPLVIVLIATFVTLLVAVLTRDFWAILVVGALGMTPLRRSVRRHKA